MNKRDRIISFIIGITVLTWAWWGHAILIHIEQGSPSPVWEITISIICGAALIAASFYAWRCKKCHGSGHMLDLGLTGDPPKVAAIKLRCDWCNGDGKVHR